MVAYSFMTIDDLLGGICGTYLLSIHLAVPFEHTSAG